MKDVLVVANPSSAGGRTGREWPRLAERLRAGGLDFDVAFTSRPLEATELARAAVQEGRALVVAAGGDGTISETAAGFLDETGVIAGGTRFGVVPTGTGGDFRRTFGIPLDPEAAARVLVGGHTRRIDAGRVEYTSHDGDRAWRHFVNIADAGIGGEVVHRVNHGRRVISGSFTFLLASVRALAAWRNLPVTVDVDGTVTEVVAQQVVVANCQWFGGGMRMAPMADPSDGLLDVVVVGDVNAIENMRGLARVRNGTHLEAGNPKWTVTRGRRVTVSGPAPVRVDVDGEQPGFTPATFTVVPGALDLVVPAGG